MKYAVIYESRSGNTKKVAETIFEALQTEDKVMVDVHYETTIPQADFYFIGFGIRSGNCSITMVDVFEKLEGADYALFMTCGLVPSEKYEEKLLKSMNVWLPEEGKLIGTYLCQGKVEEMQQIAMKHKLFSKHEEMDAMFAQAALHPDEADLQDAAGFAQEIQRKLEGQEQLHE